MTDSFDAYDGTQQDLDDRQSLRRVEGLSTQVRDISEVEYRDLQLERVVLVSVWTSGSEADAERAVAELQLLAHTAGSTVLDAFIQRRQTPDPATYIGSGKVAEVRDAVIAHAADTVICDGELSPAQLRNLEDRLGVKVVDRTALILDIFASHAKSAEGKAQVELAQLQYLTQRLRGWGGQLSRQVGGRAGTAGIGIGGRGPGETKLEMDRRRINSRIAQLRRHIADLHTRRDTSRKDRRRHQIASVAIVGYTNAGKSSLLNRITRAGVLVEDALFATLDPTTRRHQTDDGRVYTLTDTVGFVRHLPHDIVEAFRSTLEETTDADLLVHVVDGADADPMGQIDAVHAVLAEIGASSVPELLVINKTDLADETAVAGLRARYPEALLCSARTGEGIDAVVEAIESRLPRPEVEVSVVIPWDRGDLVDDVHTRGEIIASDHRPEGTFLHARVHADLAGALEPYGIDA